MYLLCVALIIFFFLLQICIYIYIYCIYIYKVCLDAVLIFSAHHLCSARAACGRKSLERERVGRWFESTHWCLRGAAVNTLIRTGHSWRTVPHCLSNSEMGQIFKSSLL